MPTATHPLPCPAPPAARLRDGLRRLWARLSFDPDEAHLREAVDLADLEARLRRLERGRPDRFGPLPP